MNDGLAGWLEGLIGWVNGLLIGVSEPFTDWREGTAEWVVRSGENFGKWLGDTVAIVMRDPQSIAIGLATIVVVMAIVVVALSKLLGRSSKRKSDSDADDRQTEPEKESLSDRLFAIDDPQG